jgi:hypothetical protein
MRMSLDRGLVEAGLAACISSFCLCPFPAASQLSSNQPALSNAFPDVAAVERLQQQQQAIVRSIERIHQDSQAALDRYTDTVLAQFNLLQDSFAAQQADDLDAAERLNRFTRNAVLIVIGTVVLSILVLAWVPLWATHRMTKKIIEVGRARNQLAHGTAALAEPEALQIESALGRLEQRLLSLETESHHVAAPERAATVVGEPRVVQKPSFTPRVALALSEGSAIVFLPHDVDAPRFGGLRRQFARLRRLWTRPSDGVKS